MVTAPKIAAHGNTLTAPTQPHSSRHVSSRISQLDGIRALAILAVFLTHAFNAKMLWTGVDLFFILSGFLITGILIERKTSSLGDYFRHFYTRRARRILPPYLLLLIVVSAVFGLSWMQHWYMYLFLMNFLKPLSMSKPDAFVPLWSLAVEEQFYLVWPFAVYALSEAGIAWLAASLIVLAPLLRWFCTPLFPSDWFIYMTPIFRMDLLAMGALLAIAWRHRRSAIERYGLFGLPLAIAAALTLVAIAKRYHLTTFGNSQAGNVLIYEFSLIACTGIICWALGGRAIAPLTWAPAKYLGRISYSFYLFHLTFLILAFRVLHNPYIIAAVAFAASVGTAALLWHFMEKPILSGWPSHRRNQAAKDEQAIAFPTR